MGLAASQARFLAITSRKADCEYRSMQIAQDKLSVTRDLAQISDDYQNAINQTTLLWQDAAVSDDTYNLSYGILMTPSTLNNYNPYLITTRTGAVVLNSQYAAAAKASISADGSAGSRTSAGFANFVNALAANGIMTQDTADAITGLTNTTYKDAVTGDPSTLVNLTAYEAAEAGVVVDKKGLYDPNAGYGSEPLNKNSVTSTGIAGLINEASKYNISSFVSTMATTRDSDCSGFDLKINGQKVENNSEQFNSLTLADLLTDNVAVAVQWPDDQHTWGEDKKISGVTDLVVEFTDIFKQIFADDSVMQEALADAQEKTILNLLGSSVTVSAGKISASASTNRAFENVDKYNNYIWVQNKGSKYNSTTAISLTNLLGSYLTYVEIAMNGYNSGYQVTNQSKSSNLVIDDPYYSYLLKDKDGIDNLDIMKTDFYMQLYNNICINGWTDAYASVIEDDNSMSNLLKNGQLFITSLNGDGYFYQGRYNESEYVVEIKDEDAIAQAEAEYTSKKSKLTYKEEKLDLDMKNLDTEISSLTTEYDTVKNLISKNVEKVFTMFQ